MQLDGIKEQSRNMKSPQEGRSRPSCGQFRCTGQVPEGHRGQEMDVSGEECFSQCRSSTPGRWLRTSEPQDGLMRTRRTKKKRWQEMEGQAQACRISEDVGNMEKSAAWAYLGRPGLRCSLRTRQIGAKQQCVRHRQLWPSGCCPAPEQPCQVLTGRCGIKSTFRAMLESDWAKMMRLHAGETVGS